MRSSVMCGPKRKDCSLDSSSTQTLASFSGSPNVVAPTRLVSLDLSVDDSSGEPDLGVHGFGTFAQSAVFEGGEDRSASANNGAQVFRQVVRRTTGSGRSRQSGEPVGAKTSIANTTSPPRLRASQTCTAGATVLRVSGPSRSRSSRELARRTGMESWFGGRVGSATDSPIPAAKRRSPHYR